MGWHVYFIHSRREDVVGASRGTSNEVKYNIQQGFTDFAAVQGAETY